MILAINIIIQGIILLSSSNWFFSENFWQIDGQISVFSTNLFIICTITGLWASIGGMCGIMTFKIHDRCYTFLYGLTLVPILFAMVSYSADLSGLSVTMNAGGLALFCNAT